MNKKTMLIIGGVLLVGGIAYVMKKNADKRKAEAKAIADSEAKRLAQIATGGETESNASGVVPVGGGTNRFKCSSTGAVFNGGTYGEYQAFEAECTRQGGSLVTLANTERAVRNR